MKNIMAGLILISTVNLFANQKSLQDCNVVSCDSGYIQSGNSCIVDTSFQICTPNATSSNSCYITNGSGEKTKTCSADGESWGSYGTCNVTLCDTGYMQSGNSCIINTIEPISLTPPTGVSATDGTYTDKVRITWDSVSGATEYHVHRASTSSGYYVPLGKVSSTLFDDINTNSNITYYYKVKAYNISTDYSAYSDDGSYSDYNGGYSSNWMSLIIRVDISLDPNTNSLLL